MRAAIDYRVRTIVLDSLHEIERVARIAEEFGVVQRVLIRLTPGVEAHTHEAIATAHEDVKFGFSIASGAALEAARKVRAHPSLKFAGVHAHIGSQIFDTGPFELSTERLIEFLGKLKNELDLLADELVLGGGYGIAYVDGDDPIAPATMMKALSMVVDKECKRQGFSSPKISIEPGRAIIGPSMTTIYEVGTTKEVRLENGENRRYISVDGGMSDNIRPGLYGARYMAILANRNPETRNVKSRVVGKHCETGDIVISEIELPSDIAPGDLLAVPATGAYGRSMASNYNHVPRPPVISVVNGTARTILRRETESKKSVITANKALLAKHGAELFEAADKNGVDLYYEAAVGGAIPILRPLRESIVGDHVHRIMGIVNGTTNYILTKMDERGSEFALALKEAQDLGFAEANPSADVDGNDAAAKAAILAGLAFHTRVSIDDVYCEGISKISSRDVQVAHDIDHIIKLLAIAESTPDNQISVRVHPTLIPREHPLAAVRNSFNAIFVEAESAGELMFYGRGAGGAPTASAVLGDLIAIARNKTRGGEGHGESDYAQLAIAPIDNVLTRYLIRLDVADKPGVLASVAQTFASHNVSIETVRQSGRGSSAELIVMTHTATDSSLAATVDALSKSDVVKNVESVIRVEGARQ
ncbi:MAG: diaminopimelate decarboxylase [Actinobacteria bacterium]|nr:diaminopimelate decarboxylase [Actinomycetota bacterium]